MVVDSEALNRAIAQYPQCHPLLVLRSFEHAESISEMESILSFLSKLEYPVCWSETGRCWVNVDLVPDRRR